MSSLKKPRIQLLAIGWATLAILSATAEAQDLTLSVDPYSGRSLDSECNDRRSLDDRWIRN